MRSDEAPKITTTVVEVPGLGTITGLSLNNDVCQYLGIQYAKVPGRFRRAVAAPTPWPDRQWDGTVLG